MKPFLILFSILSLCYCTSDYSEHDNSEVLEINNSKKTSLNKPAPLRNYDSLKQEITIKKNYFQKAYKAGGSDVLYQAGIYLDSMISEQLFPHWLGTEWDFNGHTNEPKKGQIACGYLVSTLLKHADFKLNRYKLAQQSSFNEIKTLVAPKSPTFLGSDHLTALNKIKKLDDGLYILGLSFHVGLIRVDNGVVNFLHSTYLKPGAVVNELASDSDAFKASDVYYIGKISGNKELIKKWITSAQISIIID